MRKHVCLLVLFSWLPALAWGQSLADAARKERERREKNKQQGVVVREFSEEEVFGADDEDQVADGADEVDALGGERSSPGSLSNIDSDAEAAESDPLEVERRNRARDEAEWRSRFQQARQRVVGARERVQFLKDLNLMPGERYVDVNGNTVIRSLEQLRRLMTSAEEELSAAERALSELEEEARRAGVPPGWRR